VMHYSFYTCKLNFYCQLEIYIMKNITTTIFLFIFGISLHAQDFWEIGPQFAEASRFDPNTGQAYRATLSTYGLHFGAGYLDSGSRINPTSFSLFVPFQGTSENKVLLDHNDAGGKMTLLDGKRKKIVELGPISNTSSNGDLKIYNSAEKLYVRALASTDDHGQVWTYGTNEKINVYIGADNSSDNHGWIQVCDAAGTGQAGIKVDASGNGIVYGDTKSFKISHPTKRDTDIWYACIEGPEAAIYDRGTAQLFNGEAFVPYSESFDIVANDNAKTTTIQLTPQEWDTYGLAVVQKTPKGFYVKELKGGNGNYEFDWEAKGVRSGKEDFQVFRPKSYFTASILDELPQENNIEKSVQSGPSQIHIEGSGHNKK